MSQNLVNALPETITIREYLENMLQEENISLKILEKSKLYLLFIIIFLLKLNPKHVLIPKVPSVKQFLAAKHVLPLNRQGFVLDVIFHVIWIMIPLKSG